MNMDLSQGTWAPQPSTQLLLKVINLRILALTFVSSEKTLTVAQATKPYKHPRRNDAKEKEQREAAQNFSKQDRPAVQLLLTIASRPEVFSSLALNLTRDLCALGAVVRLRRRRGNAKHRLGRRGRVDGRQRRRGAELGLRRGGVWNGPVNLELHTQMRAKNKQILFVGARLIH